MAGDRDVRRDVVVKVLKHHGVLISDQDGKMTVGAPDGTTTEVLELPDRNVSYRLLHRFQAKYKVPIHYFYHPEELEQG